MDVGTNIAPVAESPDERTGTCKLKNKEQFGNTREIIDRSAILRQEVRMSQDPLVLDCSIVDSLVMADGGSLDHRFLVVDSWSWITWSWITWSWITWSWITWSWITWSWITWSWILWSLRIVVMNAQPGQSSPYFRGNKNIMDEGEEREIENRDRTGTEQNQ